MMHAALADDAAGDAFGHRRNIVTHLGAPFAAPRRHAHHLVRVDGVDAHFMRTEQPLARAEYLLEHRRRVGHRPSDRAEYAGGSLLLLQRLLHLLEQPSILNRDDRLIGEGPHQFDGSLAEQAGIGLGQHDHLFDLAGAQQRDPSMFMRCAGATWNSGSASLSGLCSTRPESATRPVMLSRPGQTRTPFSRVAPRGFGAPPPPDTEHIAVSEVYDAVLRAPPRRRNPPSV